MKNFIIFLVVFFLHVQVIAQQCGSCKLTPKLTAFDFDVQVPQPSAANGTENLWPEWKNLFILAASVATHLKNNEGNCIIITKPPSFDKEDVQAVSVGGETFTNLPSNPNISRDLSVYGDYLLTGIIKKTGDSYQVHVEVQSSCNRKVVAAADVTFQLSSVIGNVTTIAQQAASQLSPLIDKIKEFEIKERTGTKNFALGGLGRELIKITPAKKTLTAGQLTDIIMELQDCDGTALPGREIVFSQGSVGGMKITGTIGGTVTPSKVTTDAQGKAKATFKMAAGSGKPAIINAHSLTGTPDNCKDAFIGSAKIDMMPAYKVIVNYQKTASGNVEWKSKDSIMSITLADESFQSSVFANTTFYYYAKPGEKNIYADQENPATGLVFTDLRGYSERQKIYKAPEMTVIPLGSSHKEGRDSVENMFSSELLPPGVISASFKGDDLDAFQFDFNFKEDKDGRAPDAGGELVIRGDKNATFTKRKITDPNSPFKTEHIIRYLRKETASNQYGRSTESIYQEVIILSTF